MGNRESAQEITELLCKNIAKQRNKELPDRFWTLPEWKKTYIQQIQGAHKLLAVYEKQAIINALKDKKSARVYSLHAKFFQDIVEIHQRILNKVKNTTKSNPTPKESTPIVDNTLQKPRPQQSKRNKLKDL